VASVDRSLALFSLLVALGACDGENRNPAHAETPREPKVASTPSASARPEPAPAPAPSLKREAYPWLDDATLAPPKPVDTLLARFRAPPGFERVTLAPASFGTWLRDLPLAARGTPVRAYDGRVLHEASDPRIAAVIALDVSKVDLQQCADTVIRLHAEWCWAEGRRDMSYRAASGTPLPFERWARGERIVSEGASIHWAPGGAKPNGDHAAFRKYLDAVFAWANTVSLERQAKKVSPDELRPGDFFIWPGNPGHAVLVLDLAKKGSERMALLGQSYMPAQNAQVLASKDGVWFRLDPARDVDTPFWEPFPWRMLHRLES
jgi:Domain of unknown function (4846)